MRVFRVNVVIRVEADSKEDARKAADKLLEPSTALLMEPDFTFESVTILGVEEEEVFPEH